jgi:hypothetical protein
MSISVRIAAKILAVPTISLQELLQSAKHFAAHMQIMQTLVQFAELKIADHDFR